MATRRQRQTKRAAAVNGQAPASTVAASPPPLPPGPPAETLAPETDPAWPAGLRVAWLPRPAGVRMDEDTALTISAVWSAVRFISEAIAALPWHVFRSRLDGRGRDPLPSHPVDWLIHRQANPETTAFTWRESLVAHALLWGNGYAEIERDQLGRPAWLWQVTPDRVQPDRDARGRIVYDVWNQSGPNTALEAVDCYHLKGFGFDGLVGYSVVRMAALSMGSTLAAERAAADMWANDSTPGGVLEHPGKLSPDALTNLRNTWNARHQGANKKRMLAILEEGMKWHQTGLPPEDFEFLESRQWHVLEIARWFRVPPHVVGDLSRATFSNVEQMQIQAVVDCLMPWAKRLESEADVKLFGRVQQGAVFTKLNFNARLRGDSAGRAAFYVPLLDRGIFSVNDVLELEDRNPIGPDGDKRFVQRNMITIDQAGVTPQADAAGLLSLTDKLVADEHPADSVKAELRASFPLLKDAIINRIVDGIGSHGPPPPPEPSASELPLPDAAPEGEAEGAVPDPAVEDAANAGAVQDTALNGAQIAAMLAITDKLVEDKHPADASTAMLKAAFPIMSPELIDDIVGAIARHQAEREKQPAPAPSAGSPPAPAAPAPPAEGEAPKGAGLAAAFAPVFLDAARRTLRREAHRARDARGAPTPEDVEKWGAELAAYALEALTPPCVALALALTGGEAGPATAAAALAAKMGADAYALGAKRRLVDGGPGEREAALAQAMAEDVARRAELAGRLAREKTR